MSTCVSWWNEDGRVIFLDYRRCPAVMIVLMEQTSYSKPRLTGKVKCFFLWSTNASCINITECASSQYIRSFVRIPTLLPSWLAYCLHSVGPENQVGAFSCMTGHKDTWGFCDFESRTRRFDTASRLYLHYSSSTLELAYLRGISSKWPSGNIYLLKSMASLATMRGCSLAHKTMVFSERCKLIFW
jgi:hypothetical protein